MAYISLTLVAFAQRAGKLIAPPQAQPQIHPKRGSLLTTSIITEHGCN